MSGSEVLAFAAGSVWTLLCIVVIHVIRLRRRLRTFTLPAQYRRGAQIIKNPPPKGAVIPRELYERPTAQSIGITPSEDFVPPKMSLDPDPKDRS